MAATFIMKLNVKSYRYIKEYIQEGDVLLFRGEGFFSKLISSTEQTPYTHVALASWPSGNASQDEILECVEFREGSLFGSLFGGNSGGGGRCVNLAQEVQKYKRQIDVYRPDPNFYSYDLDDYGTNLVQNVKDFDGKQVTNIMRSLTGLPYGWKRIYWMAKHKLLALRFMVDMDDLISDSTGDIIYPVCSTAVAYCFNKCGYDLVRNRSDQWTEPGDIARSVKLNYLFTLK